MRGVFVSGYISDVDAAQECPRTSLSRRCLCTGDLTLQKTGRNQLLRKMFTMTYIASIVALASLVPLVAPRTPFKPNITNAITLSVPATPAPGRNVVDAAYQSFSIEFSYMADYGGNDTYASCQFYSAACLPAPLGTQICSPIKWSRTCMIFQGRIQYSESGVAPRTRPCTIRIRPRPSSTPSTQSLLISHPNQCSARPGCNRSDNFLGAPGISMVGPTLSCE